MAQYNRPRAYAERDTSSVLQPPHLTRPSTRPPLLLRSDPALHSLHAIGEPGRIRLSSRALRPSTSTVYHDLPSHPLLWYTLRIVQTTQVLLEMLQRMHPLPRIHTKRVRFFVLGMHPLVVSVEVTVTVSQFSDLLLVGHRPLRHSAH
ncbi:hypothetical protein AcW1_008268 [Taiwanofungus camphoratus]|nr:hypothetical protein AcW1_008268 [Antrodia cinnamomea]